MSAAMPAVFFGHGSPMNTLERNAYTDAWRAFGRAMPRPKAILAISAHWYVRETAVTAMAQPKTIHDFGGFPPALHAFDYPAPGDPALAARVRDLLSPLPVRLDQEWGLDHGTWSVLAHVVPEANIPVVQLAIDRTKSGHFHFDLGRGLAPLRDEGVLILGSGDVVHNLGLIRWGDDSAPYPWATQFNDDVVDLLQGGEVEPLVDPAAFGEPARLSIPTPEHYLPMLYVLGSRLPEDRLDVITNGIAAGSISMLSFAFMS